MPKLDPILSSKLHKLEPVLLSNFADALSMHSVSGRRKITTRPYTKVSPLVKLRTGEGDNQPGPDEEIKKDVAYLVRWEDDLTTKKDKVVKVDGKSRGKRDNRKEANFDFSADSGGNQLLDRT